MPDAYNLGMAKKAIEIMDSILTDRKARKSAVLLEACQLPLWGETKRGLPNVLARSALFNAKRGESDNDSREFLKNTPVACLSNYDITYRGEELRQDDASVFMQILHLARQQPLGNAIRFTAFNVLKELGWSTNSIGYKRLRECLERLAANTVKIAFRDHSGGYGKSLIRSFAWLDDESGDVLAQWVVELEKEIVLLFADDAYSLVTWQERKQIGTRSTLTLWLHSYLATHEEPAPLSVAKYHEISESGCEQLFHFRAQIKKSLQRLVDIGFLIEFEITTGDLVVVRRQPRSVRLQHQAA